MKLICTASKVSWFTVGREYEADENMRVTEDIGEAFGVWTWTIEPYNGGYRTERLEDAEFAVVTGAPSLRSLLVRRLPRTC